VKIALLVKRKGQLVRLVIMRRFGVALPIEPSVGSPNGRCSV
jgi:hypothetical protein